MDITFYGVRGSIASPGPETAAVGGNTSCVEILCGAERIILDAGTGLRKLGDRMMAEGATEASLVITDSSGQLVRRMPISSQAGEAQFLWDGTTDVGTRAPPGNYTVSAIAKVGGAAEQLTTQLIGHVGSVTIDPNNSSLTLNTDLGPIALGRVRRVM